MPSTGVRTLINPTFIAVLPSITRAHRIKIYLTWNTCSSHCLVILAQQNTGIQGAFYDQEKVNPSFLTGLWNRELKEGGRIHCHSLKSNIFNIPLKSPLPTAASRRWAVPRVVLCIFHFKNAEDPSQCLWHYHWIKTSQVITHFVTQKYSKPNTNWQHCFPIQRN